MPFSRPSCRVSSASPGGRGGESTTPWTHPMVCRAHCAHNLQGGGRSPSPLEITARHTGAAQGVNEGLPRICDERRSQRSTARRPQGWEDYLAHIISRIRMKPMIAMAIPRVMVRGNPTDRPNRSNIPMRRWRISGLEAWRFEVSGRRRRGSASGSRVPILTQALALASRLAEVLLSRSGGRPRSGPKR
jgi:hypothetical protein